MQIWWEAWFAMSENGWMDWELSEVWVQLFINETRRS
jgi:hypothetical protein